ncbi:hypothetical protein A8806_10763 [Faecalicatena orotica]|mgnify:CR=1 FL=1|jgi:hypothetical protein|uniref:Uncharacterized protein n=1 Tax=Faecalicatena orotica TaxID=1544 RepID=A0A2Y9BI93_9FIRM|nr:hypothetical protein A8806_10763 [Faecalicatena orotica]SSA56084.1 hypothetical protein SAMN05216536_10763 [Faecalicatena orotica]
MGDYDTAKIIENVFIGNWSVRLVPFFIEQY